MSHSSKEEGMTVYSVVDRETGRVIGTDLTLTQAVSLRDALMTLGDPYIMEGSLCEGDYI